jgi:uncharacterized protein (DUF3084 family)
MRSSELECALLALDEMKAQLDEARRQLKVMTEEHRLACEDRDLMQRERDEARREVSFLRPSVCLGAQTAHDYAKQRSWDCFEITMCKEAHNEETNKDPG